MLSLQEKREERRKARYRGDPSKARYKPSEKGAFEIVIRKDLLDSRRQSSLSNCSSNASNPNLETKLHERIDSHINQQPESKSPEIVNNDKEPAQSQQQTIREESNKPEPLYSLEKIDSVRLQKQQPQQTSTADDNKPLELSLDADPIDDIDNHVCLVPGQESEEPKEDLEQGPSNKAQSKPQGKKTSRKGAKSSKAKPKAAPKKTKSAERKPKPREIISTDTENDGNSSNANALNDSPMKFKRVTRSMTRNAGIDVKVKRKYGLEISKDAIIPISPILKRKTKTKK
ncbi:hypothetical protein H4219_004297 [Mycoemilia scoparia]|uniref:Uncharacterized protein n=1 Tax=Mycoemilia scoparia TaxID=417184 RepID=A0A9W7ZS44_9FUNG|nr:hypothetical protein H4219_004297 [Mycoemilia scoparia]